MWEPKIEYVDVEVVLPPPVKKRIWNGTEFAEFLLRRVTGVLSKQQLEWLQQTYGSPGVYKHGRYWNYSDSGKFTLMDDKIYVFYIMKWGTK